MVFNIQRFSIHDGPGIRTTVFFKGCPLGCAWCANPESRSPEKGLGYDATRCIRCGACAAACPEGAVSLAGGGIKLDMQKCAGCFKCTAVCPGHALFVEGKEYTVAELMAEVLKDRAYFEKSGGGITLSGGEPLMQHEFLMELLGELVRSGVNVVMETCGHSERFAETVPYVDAFYYDVKHPDCAAHEAGTGVKNGLILGNMKYAISRGKEVVARIPVIPGYNDSRAAWDGYIKLLKSAGIGEAHLLPFHQLGQEKYRRLGIEYEYDGVPQLHREDIQEMCGYFRGAGIDTQIGG